MIESSQSLNHQEKERKLSESLIMQQKAANLSNSTY